MPSTSTASLLDALRQYHLLDSQQLDQVKSFQAGEPKALAGELIRRGWLTPFQANQLLQGKGQDLLLGSYVLMERLGEGGMGAVFKAKNWKLGRIVALKLIRKERADRQGARLGYHSVSAIVKWTENQIGAERISSGTGQDRLARDHGKWRLQQKGRRRQARGVHP